MNDFKKQQYSQSTFEKSTIEYYIKNLIANSRITIDNISTSLLSKRESNRESIKKISDIWNHTPFKYGLMHLGYYAENGSFHDISSINNTFTLNKKHPPPPKMSGIGDISNGVSFFDCLDICSLYTIKPSSSLSLKSGHLQISIPVDNILDDLSGLIENTSLIFLRKAVPGQKTALSIDQVNYSVEVSSNINAINIATQVLESATSNMITFPTIKNNDGNTEEYVASLISTFNIDGIQILSLKNIDHEISQINQSFSKFVIFSLLVIIFILALCNILINKSMRRITILSESLQIIGNRSFSKAKSIIQSNKRHQVYDELDLIYESAYTLTDQLENAYDELHRVNDELSNKLHEISILADHDTLTGLYNRRRFDIELRLRHEQQQPFFLASMDLNNFKIINDSLGHAAGDVLLKRFADVLRHTIGDKGFYARTGGDEFAVALCTAHPATVETLLARVAMATREITLDNHFVYNISTSIGVSMFPDDSRNIEELYSFSDIAMYDNKKIKMSHFNYYTGNEILLKQEMRLQLLHQIIHEGMTNNGIECFFQPIVFNRSSHEVFTHEALIRINGRDGYIMPDDFIPYAEHSKLISYLDKVIIEKAIKKAMQENIQSSININLSYITITSEHIIDYIINCVIRHRYNPAKIIFEITESSKIDNMTIAKKFINTLSAYGFSFALDDFGAGFSSLSYLIELKFSFIKIDKKIIMELGKSETNHHVLNSIISLAKNLGIMIIAEGVETRQILQTLPKYDIDFLQGYYFSKPQPHFYQPLPVEKLEFA